MPVRKINIRAIGLISGCLLLMVGFGCQKKNLAVITNSTTSLATPQAPAKTILKALGESGLAGSATNDLLKALGNWSAYQKPAGTTHRISSTCGTTAEVKTLQELNASRNYQRIEGIDFILTTNPKHWTTSQATSFGHRVACTKSDTIPFWADGNRILWKVPCISGVNIVTKNIGGYSQQVTCLQIESAIDAKWQK